MMDDNVRFTQCHKPWLFTIYFWLGMVSRIGLTILHWAKPGEVAQLH